VPYPSISNSAIERISIEEEIKGEKKAVRTWEGLSHIDALVPNIRCTVITIAHLAESATEGYVRSCLTEAYVPKLTDA
jgi:hypothetical protein